MDVPRVSDSVAENHPHIHVPKVSGGSSHMRRFLTALAIIAASVFFATPASAQVVEQVTICHARAAETNPYGPQAITVSVSSIITGPNGHDMHGDDNAVFPEEDWGDIIPPFQHEGGFYAGKNWPEGQAILNNDCQIPGDEDGPGDDGPGDDDGDGDGDDDGDDDGDGDDGGSGDDEVLPKTGSPSYWLLFTGGLLTVLGIAILRGPNGSMSGMHVASGGRHVKL
jgi:LPXTG-motif cell wall-anchored protein